MASLLEQYEQATSSSVGTLPRDISLDRGSGKKSSPASGSTYNAKNLFASAAAGSLEENELPIFSKQRIEFQIPNGKTIYRMAACDRLIILATKDNTLLRMDLKNGAEQFDVLEAKTSSAGDSVDDIFLDPAGRHILLAMLSGDVFYFSRTSRKARVINKLRTHILTAVGWNYQILDWTSSVSSSGPSPVLLGTAQGVIFETEFNAHAADSTTVFHTSSIEAYWKQVCNLAQPEPVLIKGIFCDRLRRGEKGAWLYVVLIATQTRLYQFKGSIGQSVEPPLFHEIFLLDPEKPMTNFLELPGNWTAAIYKFGRFIKGGPSSASPEAWRNS